MPVSKIDICNMALAAIGTKTPIAALDEQSQDARQCARFYDHVRDRVLRDAPWAFATRYAAGELVEEADDQAWANQWAYAYRYPVNCLFVRRVATPAGRVDASPPPFALGHDTSGLLIFTDQEDAVFEYTEIIEDPTRYDPAFVDAFVYRLAWSIAMPLAVSDSLRIRMMQLYRDAISEAKAVAANERRRDDNPDCGAIAARS